MKTPIQELIEQMWEIAKYGDSYEVAPCIEAAEAMLKKEKETICNAFSDAQHGAVESRWTAEEYFEETFNTKER